MPLRQVFAMVLVHLAIAGAAFASPTALDLHVRLVAQRPGIDELNGTFEGFIEVYNTGSVAYRVQVDRNFVDPAGHTCPNCGVPYAGECGGGAPADPQHGGYKCQSHMVEVRELEPCSHPANHPDPHLCDFVYDCMPPNLGNDAGCDNDPNDTGEGEAFCAHYEDVVVKVIAYKVGNGAWVDDLDWVVCVMGDDVQNTYPDAPVCSTPESYCTNWTHPNPPCSFPSTPVRQPLCVEVEE